MRLSCRTNCFVEENDVTSLMKNLWVQYTWDLKKFHVDLLKPQGYDFRTGVRKDLKPVIKVVIASSVLDNGWQLLFRSFTVKMIERIGATLGSANTAYIIAEKDSEIVGITGLAKEHWTRQNFITGICVLPEHRVKGVEKYLLALSLIKLKEMDMHFAKAVTESGSLLDKKVYRSFGSVRRPEAEISTVLNFPIKEYGLKSDRIFI